MSRSGVASRWIPVTLCATLAVVLVLNVVFVFFQSNLWFSSDTSFTVLFAREFCQGTVQKGLWYSGNTVHLSALLAVPLAAVINDDLLIQNLYQLISGLLLLASVVFFCKSVFRNKSYIILAIMLFSGISIPWYTMMFAMCDYNQPVRMLFWTLGSFFMLRDGIQDDRRGKIVLGSVVLFLALFISLLSGIQALQSVVIPLVIAIYFTWFNDSSSRKTYSFIRNHKFQFYMLCAIAIAVVAAGVVASSSYAKLLNVRGNAALITFVAQFSEVTSNLVINLQGFLQFSGLTLGVPLFSAKGLLNILRVFVTACFVVVMPILELRNYGKLTNRERFLIVFSLVHVIEIVFVLNFTDGPIDGYQSARYHITSYVLLIAISCNYLYKRILESQIELNRIVAVFCVCLFSLSTTVMTTGVAGVGDYQSKLYSKQALTSFLAENDLTYGYATYWNACNNTVLSNERVKVRQVGVGNGSISPNLTCASKSWYDSGAGREKTFLLLTSEELKGFAPNGLENTSLGAPASTLEFNGFTVLVYSGDIIDK